MASPNADFRNSLMKELTLRPDALEKLTGNTKPNRKHSSLVSKKPNNIPPIRPSNKPTNIPPVTPCVKIIRISSRSPPPAPRKPTTHRPTFTANNVRFRSEPLADAKGKRLIERPTIGDDYRRRLHILEFRLRQSRPEIHAWYLKRPDSSGSSRVTVEAKW
ncbi:hypothetical protein B0T21DRAFT_415258 [Apiosordaria backusii]|uniref:Uncharacterized protein n=1 Tax=Apiosordaria backusii TaxID=314023 RepID=A0AA40AIL1_9PEZI|nr:hypothetical protein B0T21DRAFT_415258 [Apiosordaria backusii]